jgi:hypothetical protein
MKRYTNALLIAISIFIILAAGAGYASEENQNVQELRAFAPQVFIDCDFCDRDYFRENLTYINFVRDRADAGVHVLITDQRTGSGGLEYTFAFIGKGKFEGINHSMIYNRGPTETSDEVRKGQLEVLQRGLFPFLVETPLCQFMNIEFQRELEPTSVEDPWKFWVFSISADGRFRGESSRTSSAMDLNISANKVTPDIKIRMSLSGEFESETYEYEDETITSEQDETDLRIMTVKSLGKHWSAGGWAEVESSTYGNIESHFSLAPAVEYNFFPYSESTRRQLRLLYRVGLNRVNYIEETIFDKISETLFRETLTVTLESKEPWGSISTSLEGAHYFHDFSKFRLEVRGNIDLRIFKGLSLDIRGRYDLIRDQLALPKEGASLDEVLLERKELATNYDYFVSVGLRYTFGSVFSNVVNPRFGNGGRRYY